MARLQRSVDTALLDGDIVPVEQAVIGCVLLEPKSAIPPLMPEEFLLDKHNLAWAAILSLAEQGVHADCVSLEHALRTGGKLPAGEPAILIALCVERAAISVHLSHYAGLVRGAARERMKRALGAELAERGLPEDEILRRLDEMPGPLGGALFDPAENWGRIVTSWSVGRLKTGFTGLDHLTGGLGPGDFIVVGGRTSQGKSSVLVALALQLAAAGVVVEYVTLEESPDAIVRRMVANLTGISMLRLKDGSLQGDEFRWAENAVRRIQELPISVTGVDHIRSTTEDAVIPAVGRARAAVVIVDHLQQISTRDHSRVDGLERVMKRLQAISLRDGRIMLLAAQLNREAEKREGPPVLSDLKNCGAIEEAARQVWLLHWPSRYDKQIDPTDYELCVAKQSDGGTGVVPLRFEAWCGRFSDREGTR